jgi:hypothetical protein
MQKNQALWLIAVILCEKCRRIVGEVVGGEYTYGKKFVWDRRHPSISKA